MLWPPRSCPAALGLPGGPSGASRPRRLRTGRKPPLGPEAAPSLRSLGSLLGTPRSDPTHTGPETLSPPPSGPLGLALCPRILPWAQDSPEETRPDPTPRQLRVGLAEGTGGCGWTESSAGTALATSRPAGLGMRPRGRPSPAHGFPHWGSRPVRQGVNQQTARPGAGRGPLCRGAVGFMASANP